MTDVADSSAPYDNRSPATVYTALGAGPLEVTETRFARYYSDASVLLGALSVVAFWSFGVGILLGVVAVAAGLLATKIPEAPRSDAVIGMLTGTVGIAVGALFLAATTG